MDRRELLKGALVGTVVMGIPSLLRGQTASGVTKLTDKISVVDGGGTNIVAFSTGDGLLLVDTGAPKSGDTLVARDYKLWGNREWIKTLVAQLVLDWVRRSLLGINIAEASFIRR